MKQQIIIPENLSSGETGQKTNAFDKLVSNDQLSYLPNLYLRQYKLIDELIKLRQEFPEQKLLIERPRTKWDAVLQDVTFASHIFQERRKLKIATNCSLIRQAKTQVQRTQLRTEEQYHFLRLITNYLGQSTVQVFKKTGEVAVPQMVEQKVQEKDEGPKKHQDDIFMNEEEYSYLPAQPDLLDDLLDVGGVQAPHMEVQIQPTIQIEPISTYIGAKYTSRKEFIDAQPILAISRKATLKRINENVRKRLKFNEEVEEEQVGRSLSSATVFLSNLLNTQPESKASKLTQPLNSSQWLFGGERPRKKKDDQTIDLHWPAEQLQKMQQRNQKNGVKKGKLDTGVLMLTLPNSDDDYRKTFEKHIAGEKSFPPTLKSIPQAEPTRETKYYNYFHDKQYESFVIKHNKRKLFEKFSEKASMIFPENYSQDDVEDAQNISAGRLFIYKPEKLLKRVVFLKEEKTVKTYIRSEPKNNIDQPRAFLLAYLVEKYLREFGNNWKNITQLICRHIAFAHKHITIQFVQQIYQMVMRLIENNPGSLPTLQLWDKKILPFSNSYIQSYTAFSAKQPLVKIEQKMQQQSQNGSESNQEDVQITPEYYRKLIDQEVTDTEEGNYQTFEKDFEKFLQPFIENINKLKTNSLDGEQERDRIAKVLEAYKQGEQVLAYENGQQYPSEFSSSRSQILTQNLKGEIKVGTPYRKKKSINQRNNELVKILQALRNKTAPNPAMVMQKKPEETKPSGPLPAQKINPIPAAPQPKAPTDANAAAAADLKKTMKSPEKPDKKLGAPSKKDKKKDGEEKK